jgi:hypothetical protein
MSNFIGKAEQFLEKVFGKIASPTTLCIDEREK